MRKLTLVALSSALCLSALNAGANALPLIPKAGGPKVGGDEASAIVRIADGCGWNRHYSPRVHHCVFNGWRRWW